MLIALVALIGHFSGIRSLYSILPQFQAMSPTTAILAGILSLISFPAFRQLAKVTTTASACTAVAALLVLAGLMLSGKDVVNEAFSKILGRDVGHTSIGTLIAILAASASLYPSTGTKFRDMCAGIALLVAGTAILGHTYGATDLYALSLFRSMSLNTALCVGALAIATIAGNPGPGWASTIWEASEVGAATRRQLLFLLVPPISGFVIVVEAHQGHLRLGAAMALLVTITVTPLFWLILRDGRALSMLARERQLRNDSEALHLVDLQQKLSDQAQLIEKKNEEAAEALERANAVAQQNQKIDTIGHLTGGVAHDFNNLLAPILGNLDMLRRRSIGNERDQRMIHAAMQSAERARTLVQRLLAFARRQPLQVRPTDVGALVRDMREIIASTCGPNVEIVYDIDDQSASALVDPHQIELAVLNLCVNARDAMPDGGILTISVEAKDMSAGQTSKVPATGKYVCLSVNDNGLGMSPDVLQHAIEPFYSTKGIGQASGLGLSMVHGLAMQLNGALEIASNPGDGTRIDLWMPRSLNVEPIVTSESTLSGLTILKGRVLVVDDEDLVRMTTAAMLEELGFETTEVSSASAAEILLRNGETFSLVVTDHLMPGITGAELASMIKLNWPHIPVLLVSGYADPEGVSSEITRLTKPFHQEGLAAAIATLH